MKYAVALAALAAVVVAQEIPACAVPCIREAVESATDCTWGDYECLCIPANREAATAGGTQCVIDSCGLQVALNEVVPAIAATCENPPTNGGGAETTTSTPPPAETSAPAESSAPAAESSASAAPSAYPPPAESSASSVPYPIPSHTKNDTIPEPSESHEAAGAGKLGFMGAAAMLGLAALAL